MNTFTPRPTPSHSQSAGLVRRLVGLVSPHRSVSVHDAPVRRRTMDRLIAELNRGA